MISREKEVTYKLQLHFSSGSWQASSHLGFCTSLATLGRGMLCFIKMWIFRAAIALFATINTCDGASQVVPVVKNLPANAGDLRDTGSTPGSGRTSEGRYGNPFQYSCLENPMDRGAWWATVHRAAQSWT